jgi:uncharacterized protein (TIGR03118 family)
MFSTKSNKSQTATRLLFSALVLLAAATLFSLPASAQKVAVTYLTSDIANVQSGAHNDSNLVNPWGLSISPIGPWWVSDNGTGLSTLYDSTGTAQALVVTIPSAGTGPGTPTGTVFNATGDFKIGGVSPAFIFATEDGTISGWSSGTSAVIAVNNNPSNAVYKGMALASAAGSNYLYLANFHAATVEVYDKNFAPHSFGSNAFVDATIPTGYAPFNIQAVGSNLVVTYAKQDAARHDDVPGPGNGWVDIYDTQGNVQLRLAHNLYFNSPWGVVMAPASFSGFAGDLLIGNFGSGSVMAFNPNTGAWIGNMFDVNNLPLKIDGLWALAFGNGHLGGPTSTLFFTAGVFGEAHGLFGSMVPRVGP